MLQAAARTSCEVQISVAVIWGEMKCCHTAQKAEKIQRIADSVPLVQSEGHRDLRGGHHVHTDLIVSKHVKHLHNRAYSATLGKVPHPVRDTQQP